MFNALIAVSVTVSLFSALFICGPTAVITPVSHLTQWQIKPFGFRQIAPGNSSFSNFSSWRTLWTPLSVPHEHDDPRQWNLLHHLGGYSPWIEKTEGVSACGIEPPPGCVVDSVHMMSRHAERYPTLKAGGRHLKLLARIKESGLIMNGSLSFVNDWVYLTESPQRDFEQLTSTGPYAGTLQAFTTGVKLRTLYSHLVPSERPTKFWASDSARVIDTALHFAAGFFGLDWEKSGTAQFEVIPETEDLAANTLTPGETCTNYVKDLEFGHAYGANMLSLFQDSYMPSISRRFAEENPSIQFTNSEVFSMQEMCAFETLVRGSSPWCAVFTTDEWESFEYARDLVHFYRGGPGNPYGPAMGWLWLNTTAELLLEPRKTGQLFFSFVHDGDIAPMLAALDIFRDDIYGLDLPVSQIGIGRKWKTSQVLPMGGRIIFERLSCPHRDYHNKRDDTVERFVRININDGIVPLPGCSSGPGESCPLPDFVQNTRARGAEVGGFGDVCGLKGDFERRISFLRQQ